LSSYEMPTLHFSSATGVCNLSMVQIYQRFFTSFRMTLKNVTFGRFSQIYR
jgi:hypothetical protein